MWLMLKLREESYENTCCYSVRKVLSPSSFRNAKSQKIAYKPSTLAQAEMLLPCIRKVTGLDLVGKSDCPHWVLWWVSLVQSIRC
jgi:hypothetical protein